jgi:hypothetical protein
VTGRQQPREDEMSEPEKDAPEPSMEEILSSIRRIIAEEDDDAQARPQAGQARPAPVDRPGDDVLVLTDRIDDGPRQPVPALAAQQDPPVVRVAPAPSAEPPAPVAPPAKVAPVQQESSMPEQSALVSNTAAAISAAAFSKLARAAAPNANEPQSPISGMTVEQLLMSMLEPMLKDWFDKNLPAVVERIVEEEVKKLVRRAELQ